MKARKPRPRITPAQLKKVMAIKGYLETPEGKKVGIPIKAGMTHVAVLRHCFQNVTGFYIIGSKKGEQDRLKFGDIHAVYTAAMVDKAFSAHVKATAKE